MPLTPFHFGPGLAFKAALGDRFSLGVFAMTQVAIDLEVLYAMAVNKYPIHGFCHTFVGATVVTAGAILFGRALYRLLRRWILAGTLDGPVRAGAGAGAPASRADPGARKNPLPSREVRPAGEDAPPLRAVVWGAVLGSYSHVLLDAMLHSDASPFAPFMVENPMLGLLSYSEILWLCVLLGVAGSALLMVRNSVGVGERIRPS